MRAICAALSDPAIWRWLLAASSACTASVGARASDIRFMLVGLPVSGSVAAGMPFLPMNGLTPKFWCVVYFVLATGRGRRKTEIVGFALFTPYTLSMLQPLDRAP